MSPKILLVLLVTLLLFLVDQSTCSATTVTLEWDAVADPKVAGYNVYYQADSAVQPFAGTGAAQGSSPVAVDKLLTSATISGLDSAHAYYFAVTAYDASGAESAYSNTFYVPELTPPTVSITSPANNATVSGTVSVTANATDNVGVTKVEFYVNDDLQATDTATTCIYSWNTSTLAPGNYTLTALAYDAAGNVGQSSSVLVSIVKDTTPPVVAVTSPSSGATLSGTVAITATASDTFGVGMVEFYGNGILLSATNVSPYSYNWNTTTVSNGSYTLSVVAYDASGNKGQAGDVTVAVNNTGPDTTAPTVSVTAPANNASVSGVVTVAASASDNVGVTRVRFYVNGILKSTVTAAPFVYNWDTTGLAIGTYYLYVKANDAANNTKTSSTIIVTVFKDSAAPSVTVTSPAFNDTVSGIVTITANAADNAALKKVEFYVNNVLQGAATAAPFSYNWNTTLLSNGSYTLFTKAYDTSNNVGQSASVAVTVSNIIYNQETGVYYSSLQQAYDSASTGDTLKALGVQDNGSIVLGQPKSVNILGGYSQGFTSNSDYTYLHGTYTIGQGTVVMDRLIIN